MNENVEISSNELFWYIKNGERVRQIRRVITHPSETCLDDREETIGILCTALAECQRERDELKIELTDLKEDSTYSCWDCHDTGILNNRVDGDYLCNCIVETDAYEKIIQPMVKENAQLRAQLAAAVEALIDAKESVESWGSYASDYFKEKHGYLDDLQNIQQVIDFLSSVDVVRSIPTTSALDADILKACDEEFKRHQDGEGWIDGCSCDFCEAIKKRREVQDGNG